MGAHFRRHGRCRVRWARGVSLVEALTTIGIISIAAGAAVMSTGPMLHPATSRSATQQLAADLRLTRMKAIAQHTRFRVSFDTEDDTYTVERETGIGTFVVDEGPLPLPGRSELGAVSPADPIFDTRGGVTAATTITVGVPSTGLHTVTINPLGVVRTS